MKHFEARFFHGQPFVLESQPKRNMPIGPFFFKFSYRYHRLHVDYFLSRHLVNIMRKADNKKCFDLLTKTQPLLHLSASSCSRWKLSSSRCRGVRSDAMECRPLPSTLHCTATQPTLLYSTFLLYYSRVGDWLISGL